MPQGKELGEFNFKSSAVRVIALDGDERTIEISVEGEVTGQLSATVLDTVTFRGTDDRGSYAEKAVGYLGSGDAASSEGAGVYWLTKPGEWETRGVVQLDLGQKLISEGRVELATRTWSGKIYELT